MGLSRDELVARQEMRRGVDALNIALARCRRAAVTRCEDPSARNLTNKLRSGRLQLAAHCMLLHWDPFTRGAPDDALEAFWRRGLGVVRGWCARRRAGESVEIPALVQHLIAVQHDATVAEVALLTDQSPKAFGDAHDALARLVTELEAADARLVA